MADTRSRVPIAVGTNREDERGFYQRRLRLFTGCAFLISGGFYVLDIGVTTPGFGLGVVLLWTPHLLHLGATLLAGAFWVTLRQRRLSPDGLRRFDATATILLSTSYALIALAALDPEHLGYQMSMVPERVGTAPLMACTYVVLIRALAIPSRPRRALWISTLSMLPIIVLGRYVLVRSEVGGLELRLGTLELAVWTAVAVVVAAIGSRVIFGLRTEVARMQHLGQYTLEQKIGEGGMGMVYRASPAMLRRPTAIKLLPPDKVGEASLLRFEREVQLTARLTHPNTVAVFDYGRTPDGIFYYAMEYLDGLNLTQLVAEDGSQFPGRVIHLLVQVCGSLAEAHGVGLFHRDIKPPNILLVERGGVPDVVKVVDFGLAKRFGPAVSEATASVTTANVIPGPPLYLSPEAIRNEPDLDGRSDLYAVGAGGYFLLTGQPVFQADSVVGVLSHHLSTRPVPPSQRAPCTLPAGLEDLILQCLAKDRADRPRDAQTLQRALAGCPCDPPWSMDDATAWWTAYHARRSGKQQPTSERVEELSTLTVDIRDRVMPDWRFLWRS